MANEQPSVLARNFEALNIKFQIGDDRITAEEIEEDIEGEQGTIPDLVADDLEPSTQEFMKKWKQTVFGASRGVTDKTESEYQRYGLDMIAEFLQFSDTYFHFLAQKFNVPLSW